MNIIVFNWLDWFFIGVIAIFGIFGFAQGFIKGLISLLTWFTALVLAYFFADNITVRYTSHWFDSPEVSLWLSFFTIIIIVFIIGGIIQVVFSVFRKVNQSITDRLLGFLFGVVKAALVTSLTVGVLSYNESVVKQSVWRNSTLGPWFLKGAIWVDHKLPDQIRQKLHNNEADQTPRQENTESSSGVSAKVKNQEEEKLKAIG